VKVKDVIKMIGKDGWFIVRSKSNYITTCRSGKDTESRDENISVITHRIRLPKRKTLGEGILGTSEQK
jgi:hypothetical protein